MIQTTIQSKMPVTMAEPTSYQAVIDNLSQCIFSVIKDETESDYSIIEKESISVQLAHAIFLDKCYCSVVEKLCNSINTSLANKDYNVFDAATLSTIQQYCFKLTSEFPVFNSSSKLLDSPDFFHDNFENFWYDSDFYTLCDDRNITLSSGHDYLLAGFTMRFCNELQRLSSSEYDLKNLIPKLLPALYFIFFCSTSKATKQLLLNAHDDTKHDNRFLLNFTKSECEKSSKYGHKKEYRANFFPYINTEHTLAYTLNNKVPYHLYVRTIPSEYQKYIKREYQNLSSSESFVTPKTVKDYGFTIHLLEIMTNIINYQHINPNSGVQVAFPKYRLLNLFLINYVTNIVEILFNFHNSENLLEQNATFCRTLIKNNRLLTAKMYDDLTAVKKNSACAIVRHAHFDRYICKKHTIIAETFQKFKANYTLYLVLRPLNEKCVAHAISKAENNLDKLLINCEITNILPLEDLCKRSFKLFPIDYIGGPEPDSIVSDFVDSVECTNLSQLLSNIDKS